MFAFYAPRNADAKRDTLNYFFSDGFGPGIFAPTDSRQACSFAVNSFAISGFSFALILRLAQIVLQVVKARRACPQKYSISFQSPRRIEPPGVVRHWSLPGARG